MSIRLWTPDDDRRLRALVAERPKLSASGIGALMGRNRNSVIGRCHRIGLALSIPPNGKGVRRGARPRPAPRAGLKRGRWSDDEVAELRQLIARKPRLSAVEIANKLNRKTSGVRSALQKHGLSLRDRKDECRPVAPDPADSDDRAMDELLRRTRQDIEGTPARFADLTPNQCRFPIGDDQPGPDMACCGQAVIDHFADGIQATHCADCLTKMVREAA